MATLVLFDQFGYDLGIGAHNFTSHTFKVALVAAANAPTQTGSSLLANLTQISGTTSGYTTGGVSLTTPTWTETSADSGTWKFSTDDLTLTAQANGLGPFRYVVLFNDTQTSPAKPLIGYLDYGQDITVTNTNTFLIDVGTSGWFQIPIT